MTNTRKAFAALLIGTSAFAFAMPASAQDLGVDADVSISGEADTNAASGTVATGLDAGASVDGSGVTASIDSATDADVDTRLGEIAAEAADAGNAEAAVLAQLDGMSEEDMKRFDDRCDEIMKTESDQHLLDACNVIMKQK